MLIEGVTANPKRVNAGSLVHIGCRTRNAAGTLTTPGTTYKVGFYDPSGDLVALTAMTVDSTGVLSYPYATVTSKEAGEYRLYFEMVHTDGTTTLITELGDPRNFEVV